MTDGRAHYFGQSDRRRFGFVHWPEVPIRGCVVICPPFGYEEVCAHPSLRLLAQHLAAAGFVAMRIEYEGTGNSPGHAFDENRPAAWQATISDAVAELSGWDVGPIQLVGLRLGATLANQAASHSPAVSGVVLWDPVLSGRRYARELTMLSRAAGFAPPPIDGIAIAGQPVSSATLGELKAFDLTAVPVPALLISRAERPEVSDAFRSGLGPQTEQVSLSGTSAMLDTDAELAVVPSEILEHIITWLKQQATLLAMGRGPAVLAQPMLRKQTGEVFSGIRLKHVAERIGRAELFSISTVSEGPAPSRAVVMLNNGLAPLIGPGGAWLELAREVAARNWQALRVDFSGIGESPPRTGFATGDSYPPQAGADIADVVAHLRSVGVQEIALVGLCSGAILAFDGPIAGAEVDAIVSINGRFDRPFFDRRRDRKLRAARPTNRLLAIPLRKTPLLASFAKVPTWFWRMLDRIHLVADPTHSLAGFVKGQGRLKLIFGESEWGLIALRQRGGRRFERLISDEKVDISVIPGLDHSMFDLSARKQVLREVLDFLQTTWRD